MQQAGMNVRFGLDIDPDAKKTYEANFKKAKFICKDIRHVSADDVAPYIKCRRKPADRLRRLCAMPTVFKAEPKQERYR